MAKPRFSPVNPKVSFPELEERVLKIWEKEKIFIKSVEKNKNKKRFVFYEGPPTANGLPGIHHVEARSFKDIIPRYKTMRGFYCERKAGWDCHGLPVEIAVEKKLGISGKGEIESYGVAKFNKLCRESVFEFVDQWEKLTKRMGYWVDLESAYETLSNDYIESLWWIVKAIWEKDLLYEDYKVVPYCPRCGTALSSHELSQGYKDDVEDPSLFVKFALRDRKNTYFIAWTTTPWTLVGNVALAVDENETYVEIADRNNTYILAEKRASALNIEAKPVKKYKGKKLLGLSYEPLFKYVEYDKKAHYVVSADFVSMEEGSGIVHTAVMYGEDDFQLGKKYDLPQKHVVDSEGKFISEVAPYAGMFVKSASKKIIEDLEALNLVYKSETIKHTYPFCWRCQTPLLYYAMNSWFFKTTAVKKDLLKNNNSINWIPKHIKTGRMGEWLRGNRDWAISRSRYWGTPLPVWKCKDCSHIEVVGSCEELSKLTGKNTSKLDLHRPFVDDIHFACSKCGGQMKREVFVIDVWFDSGSMPYAQWHYPFENKDKLKEVFPADYISEAIDQTRGWFYTLLAVSTLLGRTAPFKNAITLGHVLDENGNKMSKSKGNIVEPFSVMNSVGADAARWYFYSTISPGPSFRFSVNLVSDVTKRFLLILWNSYNYFVTYANLNKWEPKNNPKFTNILDKWVFVSLQNTVNKTTEHLDKFDIYNATKVIEDFIINDLSKWYIRRSRGRSDEEFFSVFYLVLQTAAKLIAPFTPFISDEIYMNLSSGNSVHLADWPEVSKLSKTDEKLLSDMNLVKEIVEKAHAVRKEKGIAVRQPLGGISISSQEVPDKKLFQIVLDELNIKNIIWKKGNRLKLTLDTKITKELEEEGKVRDLIRKVQEERKKLMVSLDQKIKIVTPWFPENPELLALLKSKTLAREVEKGSFKVIV